MTRFELNVTWLTPAVGLLALARAAVAPEKFPELISCEVCEFVPQPIRHRQAHIPSNGHKRFSILGITARYLCKSKISDRAGFFDCPTLAIRNKTHKCIRYGGRVLTIAEGILSDRTAKMGQKQA